MSHYQYSLSLIARKVEDSTVEQRENDGYINATAMCKVAKKLFGHYIENKQTKAFLAALQADIGIPISGLVQSVKGGDPSLQGSWVHPQVAINLATWLSPEFAVLVSKWVYEWMSGKSRPPSGTLPYHLRRHMLNIGKIPAHTHFSILQEMTNSLIAPLESNGYTLPDHLMPDISQGRMFCKFARDELGIDTDSLPTYEHEFEGRPNVQAKLYPLHCLGQFREYIGSVWMPQRAGGYFKERDPSALPALDKVLRIAYKPAANSPVMRGPRAA
jgi:hypothetical protein